MKSWSLKSLPEKLYELFGALRPSKKSKNADKLALGRVDADCINRAMPYLYYDEGVFINHDSVGFSFYASTFSGMSEEDLHKFHKLIFEQKPAGWDVLVNLECHGKLGNDLDSLANEVAPDVDPMYAKMITLSNQYYKHAIKHGFATKDGTKATLRDFTLTYHFSKKSKDYDKDRNTIRAEVEEFQKDLRRFYRDDKGMKAIIRMNQEFFTSYVGNFIANDINSLYLRPYEIDKHEHLRWSCTPGAYELFDLEDQLHISFNDEKGKEQNIGVASLTMDDLAGDYSLNIIPDCYSDIMANQNIVDTPFICSVFISAYSKTKSQAIAKTRKAAFGQVAGTPLAKLFKKINRAYEEWDEITDHVEENKSLLSDCFFNFIVFSDPDKLNQKVDDVIDAFKVKGFSLVRQPRTQLQSLLAALPYNITDGLDRDLEFFKRFKLCTSWNALNLLPVVTDHAMRGKGVIMPTFRNQFASFNQFTDSQGSAHNVSVAAKTGAGKSFLVLAWVFYILSQGGRVWIFDKGDSYKNLCLASGGVYLNKDSMKLNPFTFCKGDDESLKHISEAFAVMASPETELPDKVKHYITLAVQDVWNQKQNKATVDDVIASLIKLEEDGKYQETKVMIHDLITALETKYASKTRTGRPGVYAKYFAGESNMDPNAQFTVLEMKGIPKDLMSAVMFIQQATINTQIFGSDRSKPKGVIIDEGWDLLDSNLAGAANFIAEGYRTVRKYNGSYVTIVQDLVIDYLQGSKQAQICYKQSSYKITLFQDPKALNTQAMKDELGITQVDIIKTFQEAKVQGYSCLMVQTDKATTFHRLFVDPFSRILFSTDAKEFQAVNDYMAEGLPIFEAVVKVAKQRFPEEIAEVYGDSI
jgi:conjugal transfer ATP-binding protein TraC